MNQVVSREKFVDAAKTKLLDDVFDVVKDCPAGMKPGDLAVILKREQPEVYTMSRRSLQGSISNAVASKCDPRMLAVLSCGDSGIYTIYKRKAIPVVSNNSIIEKLERLGSTLDSMNEEYSSIMNSIK
jgi:hypothetical protein